MVNQEFSSKVSEIENFTKKLKSYLICKIESKKLEPQMKSIIIGNNKFILASLATFMILLSIILLLDVFCTVKFYIFTGIQLSLFLLVRILRYLFNLDINFSELLGVNILENIWNLIINNDDKEKKLKECNIKNDISKRIFKNQIQILKHRHEHLSKNQKKNFFIINSKGKSNKHNSRIFKIFPYEFKESKQTDSIILNFWCPRVFFRCKILNKLNKKFNFSFDAYLIKKNLMENKKHLNDFKKEQKSGAKENKLSKFNNRTLQEDKSIFKKIMKYKFSVLTRSFFSLNSFLDMLELFCFQIFVFLSISLSFNVLKDMLLITDGSSIYIFYTIMLLIFIDSYGEMNILEPKGMYGPLNYFRDIFYYLIFGKVFIHSYLMKFTNIFIIFN